MADMYNKVWDITIGSGDMPEEFAPVQADLEEDLGRALTSEEKDEARAAWRRCYQEFHQP
jgi:hypothetical protein